LPAELIDGVAIARDIRQRVAADTVALIRRGVRPGLAVILVGEDPASRAYVRSKGIASEEAGIYSSTIRLPADTAQSELLSRIEDGVRASLGSLRGLRRLPLAPLQSERRMACWRQARSSYCLRWRMPAVYDGNETLEARKREQWNRCHRVQCLPSVTPR